MNDRSKPNTLERDHTDGSLREERHKTDAELESRRARLEREADTVVESAQERADDLLAKARDRADRQLDQSGGTAGERRAIDEERSAEDSTLDGERSVAVERLRGERAEGSKILDRLLHLERQNTDLNLGAERGSADAAIESRDDFLGIVSHDVRTLLAGIVLSAAVIEREAGDKPATQFFRREALRTQRYAARMNRLIGDLLDDISIAAGKLHVVPANADAVQTVHEALEAFQPLAAAKGSVLAAHVTDDSVLGLFDRDRIIQVLANLISNAIKFTDSGARIEVAVRRVRDTVEFAVRDTGCGIASERLPVIFDRFAQGRNDRGGLGLGLYISRRIIEAHGGRLWVESTVGEGSTFTFTVPAAPTAS